MKINNWVLKAGVPLDCFHLYKRFITADTEVKEGGGQQMRNFHLSLVHSFRVLPQPQTTVTLNYAPHHATPHHTTPLHTMPWYVSFARRKYFFTSHLALRFTSLSVFNWKLSTSREREKNWVFYTLEYKFHFFPFFFFFFSYFCFHFFSFLFSHSDYYSYSAPSYTHFSHNFTSIRYCRCSMGLFMGCTICCEITV